MKTVRVAAAVIVRDEKIFAARRGYGPYKDGWEFPGGKVEPGETPAEAAVREIREELAAEIVPVRHLMDVEYDYSDFHLSMSCWLCTLKQGMPILREHEDARWLGRDELDTVDWLPADRVLVDELMK